MDTDTPCVAPIAEPDSDGPGLDLIAQVHNHSRSVIKAELQRLSRRVPWLGRADLDVIDAALEDLSDWLRCGRHVRGPSRAAGFNVVTITVCPPTRPRAATNIRPDRQRYCACAFTLTRHEFISQGPTIRIPGPASPFR